MFTWQITVCHGDGTTSAYVLDHEYATEGEAEREAENIADEVYIDTDEGWALTRT